MRQKQTALRDIRAKLRTHEPAIPYNWPWGHVSAALTGDDAEECFLVTIHGVEHFLHATTVRTLSDMLLSLLEQYNQSLPPEIPMI